MTWIFSQTLMRDFENSRSLLGQAAAYKPAECLDGEPSAPSSGTITPAMHLSHDKTMKQHLKLSRFGQMCKPLTDDHGEALLTWYREGFLAKTSAQPEKAQELTGNAQACGATSHALLAKYDPATHSLKTAQCSLLEDLTECSVTLHRWGSMRNGDVYLQVKSARITGVTESGLWQTPTSTQVPPRSAESWAKKQQDREATGRYTLPPGTLEEQVGISGQNPCWDFHKSPMNKTPDGHNYYHTHGMDGGSNSRKALAARQLPWATPTTMDKLPPKSEQALFREMTIARPGRSQPANLRDQVSNSQNWPTPTVNNYEQADVDALLDRRERVKSSGINGNGFGLTLGNAVAIQAKYPTPCSTDHKGSGQSGDLRDRLDYAIERGGTKSNTYEAPTVAGQLNPDWVEWLIGWPIGWTDLAPRTLKLIDWKTDPANLQADHPDYTPRVAANIPNRAARIKCIGNGQVPQCAATAFLVLAERLGATPC